MIALFALVVLVGSCGLIIGVAILSGWLARKLNRLWGYAGISITVAATAIATWFAIYFWTQYQVAQGSFNSSYYAFFSILAAIPAICSAISGLILLIFILRLPRAS